MKRLSSSPAAAPRRAPRWARGLALLIASTIAWQPAAAAAASQISQEPLFTRTTVQPNVALVIDDSASMRNYVLPRDGSITGVPATKTVKIPHFIPSLQVQEVNNSNDWQFRAPALNPLWYNPATRYMPWQDDDRGTFPNASYGGGGTTKATKNLTQRDMRWRLDASGNRVPLPANGGAGTIGDLSDTVDWTSGATDGRIVNAPDAAARALQELYERWTGRLLNLTQPSAGSVRYPPMPTEGSAGQDLFYAAPPTDGGCKKTEKVESCTMQREPIYARQCTTSYVKGDPIYGQPSCTTTTVKGDPIYGQPVCTTTYVKGDPIYGQPSCTTTTVKGDPIYGDPVCTTIGWNTTTEPPVPIRQCTNPIIGYGPDKTQTSCGPAPIVGYGPDKPVTSCGSAPIVGYGPDKSVTTCGAAPIIGYKPDKPVETCADKLTGYGPEKQVCTKVDQCVEYNPQKYSMAPARYYRLNTTNLADRNKVNAYVAVDINRARSRDYTNPDNRYPVIDAATGQPATRGDCAAKTWCTFEEEAQNFANWYTYYRSRMFAAIAVTSQALSTLQDPNDGMRMGFGRLNLWSGMLDPWNAVLPGIGALPDIDGAANAGVLVRGVRPFLKGSDERKKLFDWLFSLAWTSATPTREAVDAVGRYFARSDDKGPWGQYPGAGGGGQQASCRRSYLLMATDGEWTMFDGGPPTQPLLTETSAATNPLAGGGSTAWNADGVAGPTIPGHGSNSGSSYHYDPAANPQFSGGFASNQGGTLSDVTMFYWNHDLRPDLPNTLRPMPDNPAYWQHMSTLIVGYGLQASENNPTTLQKIQGAQTVHWGQVDQTSTNVTGQNRVNDVFRAAMNSRGQFYTASDPNQLRQGLLSALEEVQKQNSSGTGIAARSAMLSSGDMLYVADFVTRSWTGRVQAFDAVQAFRLLSEGKALPPAARTSQIPAPDERAIFTSTARTTAVPFEWEALASGQKSDIAADAQAGADTVAFLRGVRTKELPGGPLRKRDSVLGDIVNSTPLYLHALDQAYQAAPEAGGGDRYRQFVDEARRSRKPVVITGANDGMWHVFDAATLKESFAYVPRAVYPYLGLLARPGYQHRYYVDGPTVLGDAYLNGAWRTVAVGSTGAGGAGLFAVDMNGIGSSMGRGSVMWDITQDDESDLGSVIGAGVIGSARNGKWVLITGNGYESAGNRAVLLVIDLATGRAIRKIDTGAGSATAPNGLGAVTPVYDQRRNIVGIYAGDKLGNLWKFDLSANEASDWKIATTGAAALFRAVDPKGVAQPITAAPRVLPHPLGGTAVVVGTGKYFELSDPEDTQVQSLYVVWERPSAGSAPVARARLKQLSFGGSDPRTLEGGPLDWSVNSGWYANLGGATAGERVMTAATVIGATTTVATFAPNASGDPCQGGGSSYSYSLDVFGAHGFGRPSNGAVGGFTTLRLAPAGGPRETRMSDADLRRGLAGLYDASGAPTQAMLGSATLRSLSDCRALGFDVLANPASIPMRCMPTLPVRVWRQELK